ncbi:[protein release factor]-glutamine N5-methyltransferase [Fodinibius salinus]|uniref:peptide chain release factor N(5)-glutamine methyltransferase n=1 Tax=Fodinibius salinus TaxID=860790 RepID=A0A5D3YN17_9BACT|nr:peptide chain release factor N(5)-glutamine methyltransferase [Fodinibius salinus]TYP94101.1 [protein release factor]-glutamine N5-methyltransferase [Fodinibius salinus]
MSSKVEEWTVLSMMEWATDYFKKNDIPDPRHSIEWLLAETLGIKRLNLYLKYDRPLSEGELNELRPLVKRRARHEPLQYIVGFTDFLNARISVDERVLIPRIETEQLVEIVLDNHDTNALTLLDIGTGSGCIPIALKMERPNWNIHGVDISDEALSLAKENAAQNEVDIHFFKGDLFSSELLDHNTTPEVIISNPPYVRPDEEELLEPQVKDFEPHQALFTDDILNMYQQIISFSEQTLPENGHLYLELHEHYAENILQLFEQNTWQSRLKEDYDNKQRFLIAKRR